MTNILLGKPRVFALVSGKRGPSVQAQIDDDEDRQPDPEPAAAGESPAQRDQDGENRDQRREIGRAHV